MAECVNKEKCPFFKKVEDDKKKKRCHHNSSAFGDNNTDYYQLLVDIPGLRRGTIFYHDTDDTVNGSVEGCVKNCWTFEGDCQNGICAETVVFPANFIRNKSMFKKVVVPHKNYTVDELVKELINGGLYSPRTKGIYILETNKVQVLYICINIDIVIDKFRESQATDLCTFFREYISKNKDCGYSEFYIFNRGLTDKIDITEKIKYFIQNLFSQDKQFKIMPIRDAAIMWGCCEKLNGDKIQ